MLIAPELTKNLLSVYKLTDDNDVYMEFWRNHCTVKKLQEQTIIKGDKSQCLYRLPHPNPSHTTFSGIHTSLHGWLKRSMDYYVDHVQVSG